MPEYTVIAAEKKKDMPDKGYGPAQIIALTLRDDMDQTKQAEWYTSGNTPVPSPAAKVFGDLTPGKFGGLDFKKAKGAFQGGGGGFRQRDPKESARITRQHSQEMAIRWVTLAHTRGKLPEDFTIDGLRRIVDWFQTDVENEPAKYGQPMKVKDVERNGGTDVPADPELFVHPPQDMRETPWET